MKLSIDFRDLQIPMRVSFKHASAERKVTDSIWTEIRRGDHIGLGEGCPRPYVTGETTAAALEWLSGVKAELEEKVTDLGALKTWVREHSEAIDRFPGAWCSVELACLDLFAREAGVPVEKLLGLSELKGPFQYTAVVGDGSLESLKKTVNQYIFAQFWDYKFKISGKAEEDRAKMRQFLELLPEEMKGKERIRLDANNVWTDVETAKRDLRGLDVPLFGVEEPLASRDAKELSDLSVALNLPIILDECLCRVSDVDRFAGLPGQWIANIRVSKVGGLIRALEIVERVKALGWQVIVGAQVGETSVLTRAALPVAQAARPQLIGQEGAFGLLLLEYDMVEPFMMFGGGGVMEFPPEDCETPEVFNLGWGLKKASMEMFK